jgi:hypothetical protein
MTIEQERVKIQRSNFGGPWKDHSVGEWSGSGDQRTWIPGISRAGAAQLVTYLNALPTRRAGAKYRIANLDGQEQAGSENS